MKFGGTSVQDAKAILRLVDLVKSRSSQRLVIVSALAKVTDALLKIVGHCQEGHQGEALQQVEALSERHRTVAHDLGLASDQIARVEEIFSDLRHFVRALSTLREVSPRSKDTIVAMGELLSSYLVTFALQKNAVQSVRIDSRQLIRTNSHFGAADVDFGRTTELMQQLRPLLPESVLVGQGFIASDERGHTTTLGRGGSDYSAAIYGAGLSADRVEIWTDVDGILSCDPRVVESAKVLRRIHFTEAAEMANLGAKVLHPATIFPAMERKIPVWILNSKNPDALGTEITFDMEAKSKSICGITFKRNVPLVNIYSTRMLGAHGFLKSVFDVFARHRLSVDLIATSEVNISLTLDPNYDLEQLNQARHELSQFADVEIHLERALVAAVGGGIRQTSGIASRVFNEVSDINVQLISMGSSELNISFVIDGVHCDEAVRRLHRRFLES